MLTLTLTTIAVAVTTWTVLEAAKNWFWVVKTCVKGLRK